MKRTITFISSLIVGLMITGCPVQTTQETKIPEVKNAGEDEHHENDGHDHSKDEKTETSSNPSSTPSPSPSI